MSEPDPLEPLREEVRALGFRELSSAADVEEALAAPGSALLFVNSVCALSAEVVRPALARWIEGGGARPERLLTLLAGADTEAAGRARQAFRPHRPSAPQLALLSGGRLVRLFQRSDLAQLDAEGVARALDEALAATT